MSKKNRLAENIKLIRRSECINQKAFAKKLGLKHAAISTYETGKNNPAISTLIKISRMYKISIDDLIFNRITIRLEGSERNDNMLDY